MTDLTQHINILASHLYEKLNTLETEHIRLTHYKRDYEALEQQLTSLPDTTSKQAMIPIGKVAFMPGKLIHTNEILVLLGDKYYAERSAKQALDIIQRRKQFVDSQLKAVDDEIKSMKTKNDVIEKGAFPTIDNQMNEEGLPIIEIREEIKEEKKKPVVLDKPGKQGELPESVQRARNMMKESKPLTDEDKALFDLLKELEEEEEREEEAVTAKVRGMSLKDLIEAEDVHEEEEEEEEDDRYDNEINDTIFDQFDDDEDYPMDGVVDQEDFTYHEPDNKINGRDDDSFRATSSASLLPSKSKAYTSAQLAIKSAASISAVEPSVKGKVEDNSVNNQVEDITEEVPVKKVSRFKVMKQKERKIKADGTSVPTMAKYRSPVSTSVKESAPVSISVKESAPVSTSVKKNSPVSISVKESSPASKSTNAPVSPSVPSVKESMPVFPSINEKKRVSKFKQMKQEESDTKPRRQVSFDPQTSVLEHDTQLAPSTVSELHSHFVPMKHEKKGNSIRTPGDIFKMIKQTQVDTYPSLDDENIDQKVDLNELMKIAKDTRQEIFRPKEEILTPIVKSSNDTDDVDGIIIANKTKLDNKIMKGAVMEREIEPIDLDEAEEDLQLKDVKARYQLMRQNMIASTGGFTFDTKPEFEVIEEELPLPKKGKQEVQQQEKKVSRFKAARLGSRKTEMN
ncbi:hypothetical protein BDB01DRAFT_896422 [Pilobolus umbonatus]|nr:hypothetical protein BDB01DRAFT_896422 [Pilobolus umbonatus]